MSSSQQRSDPEDRFGRVLVSRAQIARRITELAGDLAQRFGSSELTVVPVMTGALMFVGDLVRQLPIRMQIEPVSVSSYPGQSVRSQGCVFRLPPPDDLRGRSVLIVDDILDSGKTLAFLRAAIRSVGAEDVQSCVLLRKERPDVPDRPDADYVGFDIPDEFVIGYGLDYDGAYRNLPNIRVLAKELRGPA